MKCICDVNIFTRCGEGETPQIGETNYSAVLLQEYAMVVKVVLKRYF